jgi:hypothetical protein
VSAAFRGESTRFKVNVCTVAKGRKRHHMAACLAALIVNIPEPACSVSISIRGEAAASGSGRSKVWVMTRRLNHTSHHRGQQMAMLRMLGRELHSNYGPTADTGGLMQNHAPTIYAYASVDALLSGEKRGGIKSVLPGAAGTVVTERPQ